jgi:hypothetical protein
MTASTNPCGPFSSKTFFNPLGGGSEEFTWPAGKLRLATGIRGLACTSARKTVKGRNESDKKTKKYK